MNIKIYFLYTLLIIISMSCSTKNKLLYQDAVYVEDFGAVSNDNLPDDKAFNDAILYCLKNNKILKLKNGTYNITKRILIDNISNNISIIGGNNSVIKIPEHGFIRLQSTKLEKSLSSNIISGSSYFKVNNSNGLKPNHIIRISSNSAWETGWSYKENDTHTIDKIVGNTIYTKDPILFNYQLEKEAVNVYFSENIQAKFKNLTLIIDSKRDWTRTTAIEVVSMQVTLDNLVIRDVQNEVFHRGFSILNSPAIEIYNIEMEGLEYGILMNYCRNIQAKNIIAKKVRHALVPANACVNMKATNIKGYNCHSVIDAHQCFNVHYDLVEDNNASEFPNCRALGSKITNSSFKVNSDFYQNYAYWSNQLLSTEYEKLYELYDTEFSNVTWIHAKPTGFNGLTSYSCRNFIINNCNTHNISLYGKLFGKATIKNSSIGCIRINSHNVEIDSCILDGNLFPDAKYVFRFSGVGNTLINNTTVKNYSTKTDLFEYFFNASNINSVTIKNSTFNKLRSWSEQLIYPNLEYSTLVIQNSSFMGFVQKLPKVIFSNRETRKNIGEAKGLNISLDNVE